MAAEPDLTLEQAQELTPNLDHMAKGIRGFEQYDKSPDGSYCLLTRYAGFHRNSQPEKAVLFHNGQPVQFWRSGNGLMQPCSRLTREWGTP